MAAAIPWNAALSTFTDINYAANFYIYVLSGTHFRRQLRRLLCADRSRFVSFSAANSRVTRQEFVLN